MPLSREAVESQLIDRCGKLMAYVGLDGLTQNGSNRNLNDPIRVALRWLGFEPSDPITVADQDLAGLEGFAIEKFLDVAELRLLESVWGNWPEVDQKADTESQSLSQLATRLMDRIKELRAKINLPYGPGSPLSPGPAASGLISAGRCLPGTPSITYPRPGYCFPWGGWPCP